MSFDKSQELADLISLSQTAKNAFSFLAAHGLALTEERLPKTLSFRDGFIFKYKGNKVSVDVEYYDMEYMITFIRDSVRAPYLFIDKNLFSNRIGYHGNMFPRNKLKEVILETAKDIRENYQQVLSGDEQTWNKIESLLNAPEEKRRLPP